MQLVVEGIGDGESLRWGVFVAVFLAGLRHGFDLDHIAAITDITSSQPNKRRALVLSSFYAVGHAFVLFLLGGAAVLLGKRIPAAADAVVGRVIGVTLVALGVYVVYSLIRFRRDFRVKSRWMLVLAGIRRTLFWLRRQREEKIEIEHEHPHDHDAGHVHPHVHLENGAGSERSTVAVRTDTHSHVHRHVVSVPPDPFVEYGAATSFGVGLIHGIGAETPSQVLLFATAAGVAGTFGGTAVLVSFVGGLFIGNSILAVAAAAGFAGGRKAPRLYMVLAGVTALVSIYVGTLYTLGGPDFLLSFLSR